MGDVGCGIKVLREKLGTLYCVVDQDVVRLRSNQKTVFLQFKVHHIHLILVDICSVQLGSKGYEVQG